MNEWKFASFIEVDKEYKVEGLNIWNHYWYCTERKIEVWEPTGGEAYYFNEYEIRADYKTVNFVVGEYSDGRLGLYVRDEWSSTLSK